MQNKSWIIKVFIITFIICMLISGLSNMIASNANIIILLVITVLIIIIGIIFDIIGTAVLTADEATFHAKASNKIKGSMGAMIAITIANKFNFNPTVVALIVSSIISSIMVGGKAIGKNIAIKKSDKIIFNVGKILNKTKKK